MTLIETTPTHYRFADGSQLVRVTEALSLVRQDLQAIPPDVLAHAAARGQAVHRAVWILAADPSGLHWPSVHPELMGYIRAFEAARKAMGFRIVAAERLVVSTVFGYAGREDLEAEWRGAEGTLDVKTGVEHPAHRLQVSAYLTARREMDRTRKRLHRWILYLRANGSYRLDACEDTTHEGDFKVFTNVLATWRWLQGQNGGGR